MGLWLGKNPPATREKYEMAPVLVRFLARRIQALGVINTEYDGVMNMGYDVMQQH